MSSEDLKAILNWTALGGVVVLVLGLFFAFIHPQMEIARRNAMIERMTGMRDSIRENPADTNALQLLIASLSSEDSFERTRAAVFLGQVGPAGQDAVAPLVEVLNGHDPYASREAAASLGEIGPAARSALPDLCNAVDRHPRADIGAFAALSLGKIAEPTNSVVRETLLRASESSYHLMRLNAQQGLSLLDSGRGATD